MSLSERNTFFHAISKNPEDDMPKLVFADWLEDDNNEPEFGEFIRHCLAVRELPKEPPEAWMPFLRHSWDGDGRQGIWAVDPAPQRPSTGITYPPVPNTIYKFTFMNNGGIEGEKIEAFGMFDGKTYRHYSDRGGLRAYREIFIHFVPDPIPPEKREERKTLEQKIKEFKAGPLWDKYKSEARLIGLINLWELHQDRLKRLAVDLPLPIIHSDFSFNLESIRQSTLPNEDQLARYRLLQNLQPPSVYVNLETPIIIDTDNLP